MTLDKRRPRDKMKHGFRISKILSKCSDYKDCKVCPLSKTIEAQALYLGNVIWVSGEACQLIEDIAGAAIFGE